MADDTTNPVPPPRKRPAPTIDLKATEVVSDPVTASQPVDPPADKSPAEAQPEMQKAPEAAAKQPAAAQFGWPLFISSAAGAAAMLCLGVLLWAFGAPGARDDAPADPPPGRLAALEQQVRDLAARPPPAAPDPRALADLAARVSAAEQAVGRLAGIEAGLSKLETTVAAPRAPAADPALAARLAALEAALRPLTDLSPRVEALAAAQKTAPPSVADQGAVAALAARLAALEQAEKAIEQRVARPAPGGADQAGRIAFVAVALRAAAERGDPFVQELSAAKTLAREAALLAPLEPYAASGVPRPAVLARELSQIAPAMLGAAGPARESGILDKLQQNAERLVRIRPINEGAGDDPGTIVARAEVKATHGDIAGALAEVARLSDAARAPAQGWIRKAEMQIAALAAARRFAETAVDALAKAAP